MSFSPVTDPALVAHGPLAIAAVDVQGGGGLVEAVDGPAGAQLDHFVGDVPQLEPLQQVNVGHVPMFLWKRKTMILGHPERQKPLHASPKTQKHLYR